MTKIAMDLSMEVLNIGFSVMVLMCLSRTKMAVAYLIPRIVLGMPQRRLLWGMGSQFYLRVREAWMINIWFGMSILMV